MTTLDPINTHFINAQLINYRESEADRQ